MSIQTRMLLYVLVALALAIVAAISIVSLFTDRAHGANLCERHHMVKRVTHGGRSWRCQRVRYAALRFRPKIKAQKLSPAPVEADTPLKLRAVRVVPIYGTGTANERIQSAFDRLVIFPAEDEP